ncbi:MAG: thioredoxin-disulfide reductase [Candidatus Cardinium sp.]|uniref:thioredoxin-disulfide reductase n=1 Tax=Cardinium endosymbiont of Dermatophagoides farinae TaxID=2597823 RepID=UPI00118434F3|nr:thioredoxin-disulfide reductase [Cardinium endosymbiont of Dermatophagoides farinae]TSJ81067.1 thioredoxin-disulfide reductase [Cardinium endosymbiont of Dermatophagoides farinae]UWW97101.1 MAG: thioredoxin-disulfide reductase [Candidatus Cardinium sp.]
MSTILPLIIIGGGPAGYTAAIYAARAGLCPVLYQGPNPGGQLTITGEVENYPGYRNGITGPAMMEDFQAQAERFGTVVKTGTITQVDFSTYPRRLILDSGESLLAQSVIIAAGASAKWLGLPAEKRLYGRGVSACAICDGFFFKGKTVVVVGGGDTAAEESLYLANLCKKVHLLVRKGQMRASKIMQERVFKNTNIQTWFHTEVRDIIGQEHVEAVEAIDAIAQTTTMIEATGLFVAIGHQPNTLPFLPYITVDRQGYIQTKPGTTQTNIPGIFAAGDIQDPHYRQAVTAAGTGCMAALEAERFLQQPPINF